MVWMKLMTFPTQSFILLSDHQSTFLSGCSSLLTADLQVSLSFKHPASVILDVLSAGSSFKESSGAVAKDS